MFIRVPLFHELIFVSALGRLSTQDEHEARIFEPEHLFFTSSGRIGVIHHVNSQIAMLLTQLQNNMSDAISGPGDVVHSKYVYTVELFRHFSDKLSSGGELLQTAEAVPMQTLKQLVSLTVISWRNSSHTPIPASC